VQNVFRKDVDGKLPFLTQPRQFAMDTIRDLLAGLESRVGASLREPGGVTIALLNNLHYVVTGVNAHDHLPDVLGKSWRSTHQERLKKLQDVYFAECWQAVVTLLDALVADARTDVSSSLPTHTEPLGHLLVCRIPYHL
jgi:hypothetical protein